MNISGAVARKYRGAGSGSRRLSPKELAQIGYLSENQEMPSRLTVAEYVAYLRPFYGTWTGNSSERSPKQLRLPVERRIGDLSHGMRMRWRCCARLPYRPKLLCG